MLVVMIEGLDGSHDIGMGGSKRVFREHRASRLVGVAIEPGSSDHYDVDVVFSLVCYPMRRYILILVARDGVGPCTLLGWWPSDGRFLE